MNSRHGRTCQVARVRWARQDQIRDEQRAGCGGRVDGLHRGSITIAPAQPHAADSAVARLPAALLRRAATQPERELPI
jgi:hypothetical protein